MVVPLLNLSSIISAMLPASNTLKLCRVAIDTYRENVAYLHRNCPLLRSEGFQALSKVEVSTNGQSILAVLNVVDDDAIITAESLGLSEQAYQQLAVGDQTEGSLFLAEPPASMDAVRRKIAGKRLSLIDFQAIADDIVQRRYSKMEMAAFVVATGQAMLDRDEVLNLTIAMTESGDRLNWHQSLVVDKHCIGGIPGNRTSMVIVPIVAAHGLLIPKTSSRAITSPAGTADTMEVIANVTIANDRIYEIVRRHHGCMVWGGTARLAPADDILISVERHLGIDSQSQMVASILAKKMAAGATHLLIDIPLGSSAKVHQLDDAIQLRELFEYVGTKLGLTIDVIISDGSQPIGRGIGPVLEATDVMQVLHNHPDAPADLRQKSLQLAGRIIEFDSQITPGEGYTVAAELLDSGRAMAKMDAIIQAQGINSKPPALGRLYRTVEAISSGFVCRIDNRLLARIALMAGAPGKPGAGIMLHKKIGDKVQQGEPLYQLFAEFAADFNFANRLIDDQGNAYQMGSEDELPAPIDII